MSYIIPCIAAFLGSLGFAFIYNIHGKNILISSLCGAASWFIYLISLEFSSSSVIAFMFAGMTVALYSEFAALIFKAPITVYLITGIIPLVPGTTIYKTMEACIHGNFDLFGAGLINTLKIGGAITIGLILMSTVFRFLRNVSFKIKKEL